MTGIDLLTPSNITSREGAHITHHGKQNLVPQVNEKVSGIDMQEFFSLTFIFSCFPQHRLQRKS